VAMFGPTDAARTGPYGSGHRVLSGTLPCQPCFRRTCRTTVADCMQSIRPESVYEATHQILVGRAT
jgi:ADP-heptose:LPS heptosyltransferase